MRIPVTINRNIFKVYEPSKDALTLVQESKRTVKSEDMTWDENHAPTLSELCLMTIVANFEKNPIFEELPCWEKVRLLEMLPTNLPLSLVTECINDEIYWERMVRDRWKDDANYVQDYGFSWKRMYLERHLQEAVEAMTPEGFDLDYIETLTDLTEKYVKILNLRELQIMQPLVRHEEENEFVSAPIPCDHIDLSPIITRLSNLTELHVQFGLRNLGADYKSSVFQFSETDCKNLGNGISECDSLLVLRIHSCNLDDRRLLILLEGMENNISLEELNFTNCLIEDEGAIGISKFMKGKSNLKRINLCNNRIKEEGIAALSFILAHPLGSPIEYLNLKFNVIGDDGFGYLSSALIREHTYLKVLNVSCCGLGETSAVLIGEMLHRNATLMDLDVSNNRLGESGGFAMEYALRSNTTMQFFDLRMTGIREKDYDSINTAIYLNRVRVLRGEKGVEVERRNIEKRLEEEERRRLRQEAEEALAAELAAKEAAEKRKRTTATSKKSY